MSLTIHSSYRRLASRMAVAVALALVAPLGAARADDSGPTFGKRTDNPDGSAALTVGRRLTTPWDARIGADVSLAPEASAVPSENMLHGTAPGESSGTIWGTLAMPGVAPPGFDKTALDARFNSGSDEGRLGATLTRTVPLHRDVSVTVENSYAVTQNTLTHPDPVWAAAETVRLNLGRTGTAVSAGIGSSTADASWRNRIALEQTLFGPLRVTTALEDAGTPDARRSITAAYKRTW